MLKEVVKNILDESDLNSKFMLDSFSPLKKDDDNPNYFAERYSEEAKPFVEENILVRSQDYSGVWTLPCQDGYGIGAIYEFEHIPSGEKVYVRFYGWNSLASGSEFQGYSFVEPYEKVVTAWRMV